MRARFRKSAFDKMVPDKQTTRSKKMITGDTTAKQSKRPNLGNQYQDAIDRVARMEHKLARAFRAWEKSKAEAKRLGKRMDKLELILG
jgi:hypothetical protein